MAQYQPMYDSFNRHPDKYVPTARISVSPNVYVPGGEIDFHTGQPKPDHLRRRRTQAKRMENEVLERKEKKEMRNYEREMNKGGVRIPLTTGLLIMSSVFFVCCIILLCQLGQIEASYDAIEAQKETIGEYQKMNEQLKGDIAAATDASVICYHASQKLNMVPASSVEAIHLSAVDTRPMENNAQQYVAAQAQDAQPTPIPMTASN